MAVAWTVVPTAVFADAVLSRITNYIGFRLFRHDRIYVGSSLGFRVPNVVANKNKRQRINK